jgi:hypothetical protein
VIARGRPAISFLKRWTDQNFRAIFLMVSESNAASLATEMGVESSKKMRGLAVSQVWPSPWNSTNALVRNYQAAMVAATPETMDPRKLFSYASLEGCINMQVTLKALQWADRSPSRETVVSALETMGAFDLGAVNLKYGHKERRGSRFTETTLVNTDGTYRR